MKEEEIPQTISIAEFKKLRKEGRVGKAQKGDKAKSEMLNIFRKIAFEKQIAFATEFKFSDERKFKFDFAFPQIMISCEYEGLMSEKSGHTTVTGYTSNCEKYNLATCLGWRMLRYTALNYKDLGNDLRKLLNQTK